MRSATRWAVCLVTLGAALAAMPAAHLPAAPRVVVLHRPPPVVIDGDTFEADLDGDGRLTLPRERIRLLFVDTPELFPSHKGRDTRHGEPAKAFLRQALRQVPLRLEIPTARSRDRTGRTLARVWAQDGEVSLALIRAGHSYFDTRFGFPRDYGLFAGAEAEAFTRRRGIWSGESSRARYLRRLRREAKTPRAASNALFVRRVFAAGGFDPGDYLGRYVTVEGRLAGVRALRKGVRLLRLSGIRRALRVVVFPRTARHLGISGWTAGARLRLEGFLKRYRGAPQLVLHYGRVLAAVRP